MTREEIYDAVQSLSKEKDLYAASEFVLGLSDESGVAEIFGNLVLDCYWKARSTEQVIHFANAGIHYCLAQACAYDGKDDDAARKLRFAAKRMATNATSFTWIGWERTRAWRSQPSRCGGDSPSPGTASGNCRNWIRPTRNWHLRTGFLARI